MDPEQPTTQVTLETLPPHGKKQELIMRAFLFPTVKETFVACGTKFGKSIGAATCITNAAMKTHGAKWRWLAPVYRQAQVGMEYFQKILPPPPHSDPIESKMIIKLPHLQSVIEFWHTSKPIDLEGAGVHGMIGDEAAKIPYEAYISAKTTTTFTRGPSMYISTPYGKNWFYKKYIEAKDEMEWAFKHGKDPARLAIHAPTTSNPFIAQEVIDQAKRDLPDRLFRQYYLAEFVDDGSIFVGVRECIRGHEILLDGAAQFWISDDAKDKDVVIGVDWAKQRDYTVFMAVDYSAKPRRVVAFQRFHGVSYVEAVKELYQFAKRFKQVGTIWHDRTGVGEALDDLLGGLPLPFHGVTFNGQSKASLVNSLGMVFEQKDIVLPNWPLLISELDNYEVTVTETGHMRYNAASGGHDDIVIALALANAAAKEFEGSGFEVRFLEELPKEKMTLNGYIADLLDDHEDDDIALFGLRGN